MKPSYILLLSLLLFSGNAFAQTTLLNVSYDVMRDSYKDLNPAFQKHWKARSGQDVTIQMSHGRSSRQARAMAYGLVHPLRRVRPSRRSR